jgi:SAM-dependent methyltransferase
MKTNKVITIKDKNKYNKSMSMSLMDKMFFIDKIDVNTILDYGCANGELIKMMSSIFPDIRYVGYDIDPEMIKLAKENVKNKKCIFTSEPNLDLSIFSKSAIILSSVIHEVYSYSLDDVDKFWNKIFNISPTYIIIRDMCVSNSCSRLSDPTSVMRVRQLFDSDKISKWEAKWGGLDENWSFTHFLLTYRYIENWEREMNENYLPISKESLIKKFPDKYYPHFINHYTLPFLRSEVEKDFGIDLQERTHIQLIMKLKK